MTLEQLDDPVRIDKLKREPPDQGQFDGLIARARERLSDLDARGLSKAGRFSAAYTAAHLLALAAIHYPRPLRIIEFSIRVCCGIRSPDMHYARRFEQ